MKTILFVLLISFSFTSFSQTNLIQNINARNTLSLNGRWHYIIDRYETGFRVFMARRLMKTGNYPVFSRTNNSKMQVSW